MVRSTLTTALLFALGLAGAGCVGDIQPIPPDEEDPETAPTARDLYNRDVDALVQSACASCHASPGRADALPKFMGSVAITSDDNYGAIEADGVVHGAWKPANARLLTKGAHADGGGRAFTSAEATKITALLVAEDTERPDGPIDPNAATSPREALAKFSACMTEADWNTSGAAAWGLKVTNSGNCASCHQLGAQWVYASVTSSDMFSTLRHETFMPAYFTTEVVNGSQYRVRANVAKLCSRRNANGHPGYACGTNDVDAKKLIQFVQITNDKLSACAVPPPFAFSTDPLPF